MLTKKDLRAGASSSTTRDMVLKWTRGDVVRKLRRRKGFKTMQALAKKAGADVTAVGRLERGGNSDLQTIEKVAKALGMSMATLDAAVPVVLPPRLRDIVDQFWLLKASSQEAFLTVLEDALDKAKGRAAEERVQ